MSAAFDLARPEPLDQPPPTSPQVFSRAFTVPAGAPWEQARAAQLEVRHGSPLPISELVWRLRRLEGWRPGSPARYAVFYLRSREYNEPFETVVEIDGAPIRVSFGLATDQFRVAQRLAVTAAAIAACVGPVAIGAAVALHARGAASDAIDALDRAVAGKARLAKKVQIARGQDRELAATVGSAGRIDDVLADIAWASQAKAPEARIGALHWDHGLLAVETRGEAVPFVATDRKLERSANPIRPGVWLWGAKPTPLTPDNQARR